MFTEVRGKHLTERVFYPAQTLRNMCILQLEHREPLEDSQDAPRLLRSNATTTLVAEQVFALAKCIGV